MICPTCSSPEMHPDGDKVLIRALKVYDDKGAWSQCLVCSGYYQYIYRRQYIVETPNFHNPNKGWFVD